MKLSGTGQPNGMQPTCELKNNWSHLTFCSGSRESNLSHRGLCRIGPMLFPVSAGPLLNPSSRKVFSEFCRLPPTHPRRVARRFCESTRALPWRTYNLCGWSVASANRHEAFLLSANRNLLVRDLLSVSGQPEHLHQLDLGLFSPNLTT